MMTSPKQGYLYPHTSGWKTLPVRRGIIERCGMSCVWLLDFLDFTVREFGNIILGLHPAKLLPCIK